MVFNFYFDGVTVKTGNIMDFQLFRPENGCGIDFIVRFQKKSIPTLWKVIRNSKGEGGLKSQNLGEGGCKTKTFCGEMDIFWNCTLVDKSENQNMEKYMVEGIRGLS